MSFSVCLCETNTVEFYQKDIKADTHKSQEKTSDVLIATAHCMVGINNNNNNNKIKTLSIHDTIQQITVRVPCNLLCKTN